jgi:hypothetical protein
MQVIRYLIISPNPSNPRYSDPKVEIVKNVANKSMRANALALRLELNLPDALFVRPQLQASITVDSDKVSAPVINAEVVDNIQRALSAQLGVDIKLSVVEPLKEDDADTDGAG